MQTIEERLDQLEKRNRLLTVARQVAICISMVFFLPIHSDAQCNFSASPLTGPAALLGWDKIIGSQGAERKDALKLLNGQKKIRGPDKDIIVLATAELANLYACLELGVSVIDSSIAGLGGCPYAKGASGNVATEDVLYMLHGMGIDTGIDREKLMNVVQMFGETLGRVPNSRTGRILGKPEEETTIHLKKTQL